MEMFLKNKFWNDKTVLTLTQNYGWHGVSCIYISIRAFEWLKEMWLPHQKKKKKKIRVVAIKLPRSHTSTLLKQTLNMIF